MINVLLIYFNNQYPLRQTILNGLRAFDAVEGVRVFRYNAALLSLPWYLRLVQFDLVVFGTVFLSQHWAGRKRFQRVLRKVAALKNTKACTVALPQDEFYCPEIYVEFFNEFRIQHIYSVSPPSVWHQLYRGLSYSPVFHQTLTGYLNPQEISKYSNFSEARDIVIGYRTIGTPTPIYGLHGRLKWDIAEKFREECLRRHLKFDISTDDNDKLLGADWYAFLGRCKYVIGVEGGTSIVDFDGTLTERVERYRQAHPSASFDEIHAALLADVEGNAQIRAISPRHLECCMTKTAQILMEGEYNGILRPGVHYLEVKRDFSNIDLIMSQIEDETVRKKLVETAYRDVVESGKYTYTYFLTNLINECIESAPSSSRMQLHRPWPAIAMRLNRLGGLFEILCIRCFYVPILGPVEKWLKCILQRYPKVREYARELRLWMLGY